MADEIAGSRASAGENAAEERRAVRKHGAGSVPFGSRPINRVIFRSSPRELNLGLRSVPAAPLDVQAPAIDLLAVEIANCFYVRDYDVAEAPRVARVGIKHDRRYRLQS